MLAESRGHKVPHGEGFFSQCLVRDASDITVAAPTVATVPAAERLSEAPRPTGDAQTG